jgi:hypothetical protein
MPLTHSAAEMTYLICALQASRAAASTPSINYSIAGKITEANLAPTSKRISSITKHSLEVLRASHIPLLNKNILTLHFPPTTIRQQQPLRNVSHPPNPLFQIPLTLPSETQPNIPPEPHRRIARNLKHQARSYDHAFLSLKAGPPKMCRGEAFGQAEPEEEASCDVAVCSGEIEAQWEQVGGYGVQ